MIPFVSAVMLPRNIFTKTTVPKVSFCKVCLNKSSPEESRFRKQHSLRCPYRKHILVPKKDRKHFTVHKFVNKNGLTEPLNPLIAVPAVMITLTTQTMSLLFWCAITAFSDHINSTAIKHLTKSICLKVPILCRGNGSCLFISVRKLLHIIFYLSK